MQGFRETGCGALPPAPIAPYLDVQDVPSADLRWSRWHTGKNQLARIAARFIRTPATDRRRRNGASRSGEGPNLGQVGRSPPQARCRPRSMPLSASRSNFSLSHGNSDRIAGNSAAIATRASHLTTSPSRIPAIPSALPAIPSAISTPKRAGNHPEGRRREVPFP